MILYPYLESDLSDGMTNEGLDVVFLTVLVPFSFAFTELSLGGYR